MNNIPSTQNELKEWMIENCYNLTGSSNSYIGGGGYEGFWIQKNGLAYNILYSERGNDSIEETFFSEEQAVKWIYNMLLEHKWAKAHLVGCAYNGKIINELKEKLEEQGIGYEQNNCPGRRGTLFRIYVFGCDIKEVKISKERYMID